MDVPRPLAVRDAAGFQHADDQYYYRPLVAGAELFTYVAHVPAGAARENGRRIYEAAEFDVIVGEPGFPLR